jgi:hypothetical protein
MARHGSPYRPGAREARLIRGAPALCNGAAYRVAPSGPRVTPIATVREGEPEN